MKIWLLSDLHVDVCPWEPPAVPEHDVLVVCGDARDRLSTHALPWLARTFGTTGRPVLYVPGNHDFYRANYDREMERAPAVAESLGIHLLTDRSGRVEIGGTRFVGATLWSDFAVNGDAKAGMAAASASMNDYRLVRAGPDYRRLTAAATGAAHVRALARMAEDLSRPHGGPTVVVTHHAPSAASLDSRIPREPLDGAYASDLSAFAAAHAPSLWLHGHIHENKDYMLGPTRVVTNPRGYVTERRMGRHVLREVENPGFDPGKVVEVA